MEEKLLRHQKRFIKFALNKIKNGKKKILIEFIRGTGGKISIIFLIKEIFKNNLLLGKNIVFIFDRKIILDSFKNILIKNKINEKYVIKDGTIEYSGKNSIFLYTKQYLYKKNYFEQFKNTETGIVCFIDTSYSDEIENLFSSEIIIGLQNIYNETNVKYFGKPVFIYNYNNGFKDNILKKISINSKSINKTNIDNENRLTILAKIIVDNYSTKTIIICKDVNHSNNLSEAINKTIGNINSSISLTIRDRHEITNINNFKYICATQAFVQSGYNFPDIGFLIIDTHFKNSIIFWDNISFFLSKKGDIDTLYIHDYLGGLDFKILNGLNNIYVPKSKNVIENIKISQKIESKKLYEILTALTVSNFLILSGPSGVGKTSLVEKISNELNGEFLKFPIKSNFTDESGLLGYWNPLLSRYEGTEVLDFIFESAKNYNIPYFLLLDEMNLSRIENYFSEFLARIDEIKSTGEEIKLFDVLIDNESKMNLPEAEPSGYHRFSLKNHQLSLNNLLIRFF